MKKGLLVLSEIYYPARWKAYIDDSEVEVFRANSVLRAVEVKAGSNKIIFEYHNGLFNIYINQKRRSKDLLLEMKIIEVIISLKSLHRHQSHVLLYLNLVSPLHLTL